MTITSWFKRNRNRAPEKPCRLVVHSQVEYGQIHIYSEGKSMHITLTPAEMIDVKEQFDHCAKRFEVTA